LPHKRSPSSDKSHPTPSPQHEPPASEPVEAGVTAEDVVQLQKDLEEAKDSHLRALADLANFRRRARREQEDAVQFGTALVLEDLLPIVDNFERALQTAVERDEKGAFVDGVTMIYRQLLALLQKRGVKPIEALGQPFDPHLHEAAGGVPTAEMPEGTVLEEVQKGYRVGDRVLRVSRVLVASPPTDSSADEQR
jgi:molecular chaperone GrpE